MIFNSALAAPQATCKSIIDEINQNDFKLPSTFKNFGKVDRDLSKNLNTLDDRLWIMVDSDTVLSLNPQLTNKDQHRPPKFNLVLHQLKSSKKLVLYSGLSSRITQMTYDPITHQVFFLLKDKTENQVIFWSFLKLNLNDPTKKIEPIPNLQVKTQALALESPLTTLNVSAHNRYLLATSLAIDGLDSGLTLIKNDFPQWEKTSYKAELTHLGIRAINSLFFKKDKFQYILIQGQNGLYLKTSQSLPFPILTSLKQVYAIARDTFPNIAWILGKTTDTNVLLAFDISTQKIIFSQEINFPQEFQKMDLRSIEGHLVFEFFLENQPKSFKLSIPRIDLQPNTGYLPYLDLERKPIFQLKSPQLQLKTQVLPFLGKLVSLDPTQSILQFKGRLFWTNLKSYQLQYFEEHYSTEDFNDLNHIQSAVVFSSNLYFMQKGSVFRAPLTEPLNHNTPQKLENIGDISYMENPFLRLTDNQSLETIYSNGSIYVLSSQHLRKFHLNSKTKKIYSLKNLIQDHSISSDPNDPLEFLSADVQ
nr:hypothetical protein [Pseudobdellovibrionaceae bacterium]